MKTLPVDGIDLAAFIEARKQIARLGLPPVNTAADLTNAHVAVLIWTAARRRDPDAPSLDEVRAALSSLGPWRAFVLRRQIAAKLRGAIRAAGRTGRRVKRAAAELQAACGELGDLNCKQAVRRTTVGKRK